MAADVVLEARGLVKDYRRARAVDGIDLVVHAGERVALLGPNGAGKTTTLLMILGVVSPDAGSVDDRAATHSRKQRSQAAERVGFAGGLPAAHRAHARARVPAAVRPALRPRRPEPADRGGPAIASVSSTWPTRWAPSSRPGKRTLIGIVRATLHRPRLLVLDEPTASLDPDVALRVRTGLLDASRRRRHRAADDEPRHDRRRAGVRARACSSRRAASSPTARPRGRRALRPRRPRRRVPPSRRPTRTAGRAAERSPVSTADRRRRRVQLHGAAADVVADARDRAPARVRDGAQPAPPVRRHAVAAGRRAAVRLARRRSSVTATRRAHRRPRATCSPASCCGT